MTEKNVQQNQKSKKDKLNIEDKMRNTYCQVPILEKVLVPSPGYQTRLYSLQVLSVAEAEQYYQDISQQWQKTSDSEQELCHRERAQDLSHSNISQNVCNKEQSQEPNNREISQILCDRDQSHRDRSPHTDIRSCHVNFSSPDCRYYKA